jgi:midasin (ATPase involved in ribosome maturation)
MEDMIKIHFGDQSDAKVLLGTYVCTDIPGEFRWCPGVLTQVSEHSIHKTNNSLLKRERERERKK